MKYIKYILIVLGLVIVALIASDYINSKPKKAKQNPYAYSADEFKQVDPDLISHKEVRQIKVDVGKQGGIAVAMGQIYFVSGLSVKTLSPQGRLLSEFVTQEAATCIAANTSAIAVGFQKGFAVYGTDGSLLWRSGVINDSTVITSIAFLKNHVVVADAGKRRVYIYEGQEKITEIEGVSGSKALLGFIVPSATFDLAVNTDGELWVVNPGMHALQHYDERGSLLEAWDKASLSIEGFSGCCNPAHIAFLPDGRFVTSEKHMPRIKIYARNGELESVVAPPSEFKDGGEACDVATLDETIVALDYDKKMIRIFERK
jgi:hypothetical protein